MACVLGSPIEHHIGKLENSMKQNGCFKMHLTQAKKDLLTKETFTNFHLQSRRHMYSELLHILGIFCEITLHTNKKRLQSERGGWGPLNYTCLLNHEIQLMNFVVVLLNRILNSTSTMPIIGTESRKTLVKI